MGYDDILTAISMQQQEREKRKLTFANKFEFYLFTDIVVYPVQRKIPLVIYEVANYENLFAYSRFFSRILKGDRAFVPIGNDVYFVQLYNTPYSQMEERGDKTVVLNFIGDFVSDNQAREISDSITVALFSENIHIVMFTTNVFLLTTNIPGAKYGVLRKDIAPLLLKRFYRDKRFFADLVGFDKVIAYNHKQLREYIAKREMPLPSTLEYVSRNVTYRDLVLPPVIKEFLRINIIEPLKRDIYSVPSIMLLGPPGSGKTTIAHAIGSEIGVKTINFRLELVASKYVGETEKTVNQSLLMANERAPIVLMFRNLEQILEQRGKGDTGELYTRVLNIMSSWITSEKRRFIAIFTVNNVSNLPETILYNRAFGTYKLPILPPFSLFERKKLLQRFIHQIASKYNIEFDPDKTTVNEALTTVAENTWAYTPSELYDIARITVNYALYKNDRTIKKEHIILARKQKEIDRITRVLNIKKIIDKIKRVGVPEDLLLEVTKFEKLVEKLKAEAYTEKLKKESIARMSV